MDTRKLVAEALGTALLVFVGAGVATLSFGFGLAGQSAAAGVVTTALAFGLVMLILAYGIGPISGAHINPAVTMGFWVSGRIGIGEAVGYWIARFVGGIAGAAILLWMFSGARDYSTATVSLGPAVFVGGEALSQLWLFIVAPLVGAVLAALVTRYLFPHDVAAPEVTANERIP